MRQVNPNKASKEKTTIICSHIIKTMYDSVFEAFMTVGKDSYCLSITKGLGLQNNVHEDGQEGVEGCTVYRLQSITYQLS
jgi:hypothetical protein